MPPRSADRRAGTLRPGCWATVRDVCGHLNVGRGAIESAIARGDLTAARIGKRIVINVESLARHLAASAVTPAARHAAPSSNGNRVATETHHE